MARQALGRGINALLGEETTQAASPGSMSNEIDIDLIEPNPQQPRRRFAEDELEGLAQSIKINGIVQPIILRAYNGRFQIVAGERRWRAAQRVGLRKVPAVIKEVSDDKLLELALIENIQRQELNPMEEAHAYSQLVDNIGLTQEQVAERVGKDRTAISNSTRLLRLADDVQNWVAEGLLSAGHGRALLGSDDSAVQRDVGRAAIDLGLSVRDTERAVKRARKGGRAIMQQVSEANEPDPNVKAAETRLMRSLNTGVKIIPGKKGIGGKIEIEYYSTDDLDRIYQVIIGK